MLIDPYKTATCAAYNLKNFRSSFNKFCAQNPNYDASYGISGNGNTQSFFITGLTPEENDLPVLPNHPVIHANHRGETYLISDMRQHLKRDFPDTLSLTTSALRPEITDFIINRFIITMMFMDDDTESLNAVYDSTIKAFSVWLTSILKVSLLLGPAEELELRVVLTHFYVRAIYNKDIDPDEIMTFDIFKTARLTEAKGVTKEFAIDVINKLESKHETIDDLVSDMKLGVSSPKIRGMSDVTLLTTVSRSGYIGTNEPFGVALESPPTMMALMMSAFNKKSFMKNIFSNILNKDGRYIEKELFSRLTNNEIETYKF